MARGKAQAQSLEQNAPAVNLAPELVKARVLVSGQFGAIDSVVELTPEILKQAIDAGQVDPHPEAVAYALSLK